MNPFFAAIDFGDSDLFNGRSIYLLIVLGFLAYLVSPFGRMQKQEREGLLPVYPAIIFVYWFLFQAMHLPVDPHVYYYSRPGEAWLTNSLICLISGAVFSAAILFTKHPGRRKLGAMALVGYILLLLVIFNVPGRSSAVRL